MLSMRNSAPYMHTGRAPARMSMDTIDEATEALVAQFSDVDKHFKPAPFFTSSNHATHKAEQHYSVKPSVFYTNDASPPCGRPRSIESCGSNYSASSVWHDAPPSALFSADVLLRVFRRLHARDLWNCLYVCKAWNELIASSTRLQLVLRQDLHGHRLAARTISWPGREAVTSAARLARLVSSQERLYSLTPSRVHRLQVDGHIVDLQRGYLLVIEGERRSDAALVYTAWSVWRLPSAEISTPPPGAVSEQGMFRWRCRTPGEIVAAAMCAEDNVVAVVSKPRQVDGNTARVRVHLCQLVPETELLPVGPFRHSGAAFPSLSILFPARNLDEWLATPPTLRLTPGGQFTLRARGGRFLTTWDWQAGMPTGRVCPPPTLPRPAFDVTFVTDRLVAVASRAPGVVEMHGDGAGYCIEIWRTLAARRLPAAGAPTWWADSVPDAEPILRLLLPFLHPSKRGKSAYYNAGDRNGSSPYARHGGETFDLRGFSLHYGATSTAGRSHVAPDDLLTWCITGRAGTRDVAFKGAVKLGRVVERRGETPVLDDMPTLAWNQWAAWAHVWEGSGLPGRAATPRAFGSAFTDIAADGGALVFTSMAPRSVAAVGEGLRVAAPLGTHGIARRAYEARYRRAVNTAQDSAMPEAAPRLASGGWEGRYETAPTTHVSEVAALRHATVNHGAPYGTVRRPLCGPTVVNHFFDGTHIVVDSLGDKAIFTF